MHTRSPGCQSLLLADFQFAHMLLAVHAAPVELECLAPGLGIIVHALEESLR
jgi:hypothetical protein